MVTTFWAELANFKVEVDSYKQLKAELIVAIKVVLHLPLSNESYSNLVSLDSRNGIWSRFLFKDRLWITLPKYVNDKFIVVNSVRWA